MVIILIDGKIISPKGNINIEHFGISITNEDNKITIPISQIKWVYENPRYGAEEKFIKTLNKSYKPITNPKVKSYTEMMNNLYGEDK